MCYILFNVWRLQSLCFRFIFQDNRVLPLGFMEHHILLNGSTLENGDSNLRKPLHV